MQRLCSSGESDVDFSFDEAPFRRGAQLADQVLEGAGVGWRELEPGEEVERLVRPEVAAVVQTPGNRRQEAQADGDVPRLRLEHLAPLVLRQSPPRGVLADGDQRRARAGGPAEPFLLRDQGILLAALDVALVADDAAKTPDAVAVSIAGGRSDDTESRCRRQRLADDRPRLLDPP